MELPRRDRNDELLRAGEMNDLRSRLRGIARRQDLATVIACAFDHRTRMLPFIFADMRMAPAGVRAIGSAMVDIGCHKTRIVLQQWNKRFRPSQMRLDGRVPDLFMVSSMAIHSSQCQALIRDACRIEPRRRPLILAGGPMVIYEPWGVFGVDPSDPWGADCAVTGEEYVLLSLLERLFTMRAADEPLRATFIRAKNSGLLDDIPGLVYPLGERDGVAESLVDTGVQRLVGDLDELPDSVPGYELLEPPGRKTTLSMRAVPPDRIRRLSPIGSLVLTFGCKFACHYCPIPAYNQRQHRVKSGGRIAEEMHRLHQAYGLRYFFGADDNFFNDKKRTLDIIETLAHAEFDGQRLRRRIRWGTEATVHDTLMLRDHLGTMRDAGLRALWIGVEDMTATFVKKGQSVDKTSEAFRLLAERGIAPMPMMMHHDSQPLYTPGSPYGLINQVRLLRKAGAATLQVLMMTPATGSKSYDEAFTSGIVYESVGGRTVEQYMLDANYVVASAHKKPWRKQLNIMASYLYFYNPLQFLISLFYSKTKPHLAGTVFQFVGMSGLIQTIRRTLGWAIRLRFGAIRFRSQAPAGEIPMRSVAGGPADHALPEAPVPELVPLTVGSAGGAASPSRQPGTAA